MMPVGRKLGGTGESVTRPYPILENIDQVLPLLKDRKEFKIRHNLIHGYKYSAIDYAIIGKDTFSHPILRECRGLKFDTDTGEILARSIHKFYNINETDESQAHSIPLLSIKKIYIKHDGSLIHPLVFGDHVVWVTKLGHDSGDPRFISPAEDVHKYTQLDDSMYINTAIQNYYKKHPDRTLLFEFVKKVPQGDVISKYPEDRLYGLYSRDVTTGEYFEFPKELLNVQGIYESHYYVVADFPFVENTSQLIHVLDNLSERSIDPSVTDDLITEPIYEGYVFLTNENTLFKLKSSQYVQRSKINTLIVNKKYVVNKILSETIDDIIPIIKELFPDRSDIFNYITKVHETWFTYIEDVRNETKVMQGQYNTTKEFAMSTAPTTTAKAHILAEWSGKNWAGSIKANALQNTAIERHSGIIDRINLIPFYGD